ncbi:uncharacterized protein LOC107371839 [Tetranychus urticae]|uniref:Uncharacterized protein n=1 Tax=Tetranychus urticae TaxID=32264 RepID=T1JWW5_TETUR|nr:uncharacterized protein LOC107371839 [Tetranychus urticae]
MDFKVLFCFILLFQLGGSDYNFDPNEFPYYGDYAVGPRFNLLARLPHVMGLYFMIDDVVIRTFPTEVNLFHENTDYTKNMSMELESNCGSSKSSFDKTDVVMLTLIEQDTDNVTSKIVKSIEIDPLSVDFHPHNLTMEKFKYLIQYVMKNICNRDYDLSLRNCKFDQKDTIVLAEMEKMIKTLKYLRLFGFISPTCRLSRLKRNIILEMDKETASLFPELTENHHFIAHFIDFKGKKAATRIIDEYKIVSNN